MSVKSLEMEVNDLL